MGQKKEEIKALKTKIEGLQKLTKDIVRLRRATAILDERDRQDDLWGEQDHSLPNWMIILMEEVGELATAISDYHSRKNWREEAVQVAAVAMAMLEQYQEEE